MSVIKHTDPVPDPRAVNQDKKNMLFSVSFSWKFKTLKSNTEADKQKQRELKVCI